MTSADHEPCSASLRMGDDFGDNPCTFKCKLPKGHEGLHIEHGNFINKHPYVFTWHGDMRERCVDCDDLKVDCNICDQCDGTVCWPCLEQNEVGVYLCKKCRSASTGLQEHQ